MRPGRLVRRHDLDDVRHLAGGAEPDAGDLHGEDDGVGVRLRQAGHDLALDVGRLGLAAQPRVVVAQRPAVLGVHAVRSVAAAAVRTGDVAGGDVVMGVVLDVLLDPDRGEDDDGADGRGDDRHPVATGPPRGDCGDGRDGEEQAQREPHEAHLYLPQDRGRNLFCAQRLLYYHKSCAKSTILNKIFKI